MKDTEKKRCMGCMDVKDTEGTCPHCGYQENSPYDTDYIPPRTSLDDRYIVGKLVSSNGEAGTYLGYDRDKNAPVWIKEYFPKNIATREISTGEVLPNAGYGAQYKGLLSDFIELCNEVRRLSVSDPVIPVENMVGENNTIYVISTYMDLLTLEEYLVGAGGKLSPQDACDLLIPLLNGVDNIHLRGMIHRGLSPYTVMANDKGKLYIDGFALSATRTGGSELKAEFFSGYSAPEQYVSTGWQGSWTDVYALATIFYRTISGVVPPKSTRITPGSIAPLKVLVPGMPDAISDSVLAAMATSAQERTQTVGSLLSDLLAEDGVPKTEIFDIGRIPVTLEQPITQVESSFQKPENAGYSPKEDLHGTINIETFKQDFSASNQYADPVSDNRVVSNMISDNNDDNDDYNQPERKGGGVKIALIVVAGVIVFGAIMAIVINATLGLGNDRPRKSSSNKTESSLVENSGGETSQIVDPEENSTETKLGEVPSFISKKLSSVEHNTDYTKTITFEVKEDFNDKWEAGIIVEQSPKAGEKMAADGKVTLTVSKGAQTIKMPDLVGMEYEEALQELARVAKAVDIPIESLKIQKAERYRTSADTAVKENQISNTVPAKDTEFSPTTDRIELYIMKEVPVRESQPSQQVTSSKPNTSSTTSSSSTSSSKGGSLPQQGDDGVDVGPNTPRVNN